MTLDIIYFEKLSRIEHLISCGGIMLLIKRKESEILILVPLFEEH